ncbi:MAG: RsmB/NOP family class I SAM-dependent RNA methyltransferase [Christensenellaceae bacterium]|nr:RsmB/NOP family class I SAM-dependent RNA methyltransferase [Christensenellaceae bacterium]
MLPTIPDHLLTLLREQYGPEEAERITAGFVRRAVTLRVNTLRSSIGAVTAALDTAGIAWKPVPWYEEALILPEAREDALRALPIYEEGGVYLQSLSSMIPPLLLCPQPGETILDMAAAPGGKTTQMAALSCNGALITACEKNAIRADRLQFNLDRQGAKRVSVMRADARQLDDLFRFDKVLLDAPCSGSGTIIIAEDEPQRRMTPDWLRKTAATQKALLQKALKLLSPGREMVYSTCSILRMENEDVLKAVLPGARAEIVPVEHGMTQHLPLLPVSIPGTLCVRPDALHEGFFAARIRKLK